MSTVTIPKKEYYDLIEGKLRYEYLQQLMKEDIFSSPPTRNIKDVISAFKATKKYNKNFIKSLERGLTQSSYFKK
ncbi:hypothetical protein KJ763_01780 [Patescibacteria group bacterium]|nr:hypothetical protein [Patescibacteria group bacterium]